MSEPINAVRLRELFREMVDIYSPSGKEEEIVDYLAGCLRDAGMPVTLREVSEGRRNVEVVFSDRPPEVAFVGHVDTVSAFDIEDYGYEEIDGRIYGLGTADMKSGCAAMVEAFISAVESGLEPEKAGLFLVVGEEESGDGTAAMLETRSFRWAVVAEPTDMIVCLDHYGYAELLIQAEGTRRHASMAGPKYNAILSMLRMLVKLAERVQQDYPQVVLNIRDISSSAAGFAVPGSCEAYVDLHLPPEMDAEATVAAMRELAERHLATARLSSHAIEVPTLAQGYRLEETGLLPDLLLKAYAQCGLPWQAGAFRSHSDANLLRDDGCKPIILGPGQLACAHTREESIDFEQIVQAAAVYRSLLSELCVDQA